MACYKVYVCDVCGSESAKTDRQFGPETWFSGRVTVDSSLPFIEERRQSDGQFCSINCAKLFLGSFLISAKEELYNQANTFLKENTSLV